jgi:NAD(P)-dependent dehydrogenase (short-subunit alcohol dehydrogenase family)
MGDPRRGRDVLLDGDGYPAHHADYVVEAGVPADDPSFLRAPEQPPTLGGDGVAAGRPALDDGPQRSGEALVHARVRREFLEETADRVPRAMIPVARPARLRDRQEPLVAGGGQKGLPGREAAIERADPDLRPSGHLVQRDARTTLQEQFLGRDEYALTVPFRVGAQASFDQDLPSFGLQSGGCLHIESGAILHLCRKVECMARRFEDKVVVITGGSDGIGLASAHLFAQEGARVYVTGRRQEMLDEAVGLIGHGAVGVRGDVTDLSDLARLYERVGRDHGRVDVVFANAGMHEAVPLEAIDEAHFDATFGLNVKGMVFTVQKALPLMTDGGVIVLNGSIAGSKAYPGQSLYNASKAAVRSFARSWTNDLKERGIRVNVVSPGGTETRLMRSFFDKTPGAEEEVIKGVPLGRLGRLDEVARAVLFLASDDSGFVAGHELFVDGGVAAV